TSSRSSRRPGTSRAATGRRLSSPRGRATRSSTCCRPRSGAAAWTSARACLAFVVTSRARNKIKHVLQAEERSRSVDLGRRLFDKEARRFGLNPSTLLDGQEPAKVATESGPKPSEELRAHSGSGKLAARPVVQKAVPGGQLREDSSVVSVVRRVLRPGAG